MILKTCARCGVLIPYGGRYCTGCQAIVDKQRAEMMQASRRDSNRRYNQKRDSKYTRFYNSPAWRALSARYTQDCGYRCEQCGSMATQVHHKQAIQTPAGWDRRLDYDNLELLCTRCHNERHERFKRRMSHIKQTRS